MTLLEKWSIGLGTVLSLGIIVGFLINLTSNMAVSLDQQQRDSELLHSRTPVIELMAKQQYETTATLAALQRTTPGVVYINSDHILVRVDGTEMRIPMQKLEQ